MSWPLLVISAFSLLYLGYWRRNSEQLMIIIAALLAVFTMVFLPFMGYTFFDELEITKLYLKQMRVPMAIYFNECQPVIYAFVLGVLVFQLIDRDSNRFVKLQSLLDRFTVLSWRELTFLFFLFQSMSLLTSSMIASLQFVLFGIGSARYGVLLIMVRKSQSVFVRTAILGLPLLESMRSGMFQGGLAVIFSTLLLVGWLNSGRRVVTLIVILGLVMPSLLIAKNQLRRDANSDSLSLVSFAETLYQTRLEESERSELFGISTEGSFELYRRLNQGWLLSAVIEKKEESEERQQGLLLKSIVASVIPRFLWPDKPKAGGKEKVDKYTNLTLTGGTSMNISPFGEILVEFKESGALICSFLYAMLLCKLLALMVEFAIAGRISFLILPLILSQVYKVETDIVTVLNFLVKGFIFGKILLLAENWIRHRVQI